MQRATVSAEDRKIAKAEAKRTTDIAQIKLQLNQGNYNGIGRLFKFNRVSPEIFWKEAEAAVKKELGNDHESLSDARYLMYLFDIKPKKFVKEASIALETQLREAESILADEGVTGSYNKSVGGWEDYPYHKNIIILVEDFEVSTKFLKGLAAKYVKTLKVFERDKEVSEISKAFDLGILNDKRK